MRKKITYPQGKKSPKKKKKKKNTHCDYTPPGEKKETKGKKRKRKNLTTRRDDLNCTRYKDPCVQPPTWHLMGVKERPREVLSH
jgi:hypothetical protein